jgi:hypothetical protein
MSDDYQTLRNRAEAALTSALAHVSREIASYPGPIAGCDAQFNHLLAERRRLTNALNALGEEVFIPTPRSPSPHAGVESR